MNSVFVEILGRSEGLNRPFILGRRPASYGDLIAAADVVAQALGNAGLSMGTRVGVCLDQGLAYVASLLGIRKAGGVIVPMAPEWTPGEQQKVLDFAEVRFVLTDMPTVGTDEPVSATALVEGKMNLLRFSPATETSADSTDAVIIFTSGTTGQPKGVVLTESGLSANVRAVAAYLDMSPADSSPIFTPPCYAYSVCHNLVHVVAGAAVLPVPTGLKFPRELLKAVDELKLTSLSANPTAFRMLLAQADSTARYPSVRFLMTGGQPLSEKLAHDLGQVFSRSRICNMYGCTENGPRISYFWLDGADGRDATGHYCVGTPIAGTRIRVVGSNGGETGPGDPGEIHVSGTSMMSRYWKDPAATAERLKDNWLHTRDVGYRDDRGRLFLSGRIGTMINVGSHKVSPEEVELVLRQVDGVVEAAVFSVPDAMTGEAVEAMVMVERDADLTAADLQRACRAMLSSHKVPRAIDVVGEIPMTLYGKIDRKALVRHGAVRVRS